MNIKVTIPLLDSLIKNNSDIFLSVSIIFSIVASLRLGQDAVKICILDIIVMRFVLFSVIIVTTIPILRPFGSMWVAVNGYQ